MTFDSGFVILLIIPVFTALIAIAIYVASGWLGWLKDVFNG
jgi:hypothetical protein